MTKFFLPHASDIEVAERVYQSIRTSVSEQFGTLKEARIYRLSFTHDARKYDLKVGEEHPQIGETVIAIFEGTVFYVCTRNRGCQRGDPYVVGHSRVTFVERFQDANANCSSIGA